MGVRGRIVLLEQELTRSIIRGFFDSYNELGFGFNERVYSAALERELVARGHTVAREVSVRVFYKGEVIAWQRLDMLIDDKVVVECKATPLLAPYAKLQLQNYLKATRLNIGLLLHYGPKPAFFREFSQQS
jgi:GxxExxY protein